MGDWGDLLEGLKRRLGMEGVKFEYGKILISIGRMVIEDEVIVRSEKIKESEEEG